MRLNRYLASCGIGSRREADRLIGEGLVTVNGAAAAPGMQVTGAEDIRVRGKALQGEEKKVVVAWYKPVGVTTTERDPHAKRTVAEAFSYPIRLTYAGRLDRDSEGLLLMTNDGDLIEAMMRGSSGHEKEYVVRTRQKIRITRLGDCSFRIVLTQGLNRQIRRMCHAVGLEVKMLKRVRVLNVTLSGLQPGMQRKIDGKERSDLYQAAGLTPPQ